jgi:hypothetical protein
VKYGLNYLREEVDTMAVERLASGLLAVSFSVWAMLPGPALAGQIVGITFGRSLYNVDPLTGNTTLLLAGCSPCGPYFGASGSPDANTILDDSIVNVHEIDVATFQDTALGGSRTPSIWPSTGTRTRFSIPAARRCSACSAHPHRAYARKLRSGRHSQPITCKPWDGCGVGLYGVSDNFLYLINDLTGVTTPVGATGLTDLTKPITDIAYDVGTGRLIAGAGC